MERLRQKVGEVNRRHPMLKLWVAFVGAAVVFGAMVTIRIVRENEVVELRRREEEEAARQLMLDEEEAARKAAEETPEAKRAKQLEGKKLVALTFDDGPFPETTPRLLDILRDKGARATFFVLGSLVERRPEVVKRQIAEGHEVGSHGMGHKSNEWEYRRGWEVIVATTGEPQWRFVRPPGGTMSDVVRKAGVPVLWNVDPRDWKDRDAGVVRQRVVAGANDGGIVLMHDIYNSTVDAVPGIIDDLRAGGYEMVTLSELFAAKSWWPETGVVYRRVGV